MQEVGDIEVDNIQGVLQRIAWPVAHEPHAPGVRDGRCDELILHSTAHHCLVAVTATLSHKPAQSYRDTSPASCGANTLQFHTVNTVIQQPLPLNTLHK